MLDAAVAIWLAALVNYLIVYEMNFDACGEVDSLLGILFWPFLHGGFVHLAMNTTPLFILGFLVGLRGPTLYRVELVHCVGVGLRRLGIRSCGLLVAPVAWCLGILAFWLLSWFEGSLSTFLTAALVLFFYGGLILRCCLTHLSHLRRIYLV